MRTLAKYPQQSMSRCGPFKHNSILTSRHNKRASLSYSPEKIDLICPLSVNGDDVAAAAMAAKNTSSPVRSDEEPGEYAHVETGDSPPGLSDEEEVMAIEKDGSSPRSSSEGKPAILGLDDSTTQPSNGGSSYPILPLSSDLDETVAFPDWRPMDSQSCAKEDDIYGFPVSQVTNAHEDGRPCPRGKGLMTPGSLSCVPLPERSGFVDGCNQSALKPWLPQSIREDRVDAVFRDRFGARAEAKSQLASRVGQQNSDI
jgi:hypothetical protein